MNKLNMHCIICNKEMTFNLTDEEYFIWENAFKNKSDTNYENLLSTEDNDLLFTSICHNCWKNLEEEYGTEK